LLISIRNNGNCPGRDFVHPQVDPSRVSRAQRSTKWCAADPGPFQSVAVPDQRCHSASKTRVTALMAPLRYALHRVRDTRWRRTAAARAGGSDPCIFLFFCGFGIFHPRSHDLKHTHLLVPAAHFWARGFASLLHSPRIEGWAERRETFGCCAKHPWGVPSCVKDARERAYDAGRSPLGAPPWRFWASGPRFRLLRRPPSYNGGQLPSGSVQRAPRSQVIVPGGRGPGPPGASGYEPPPQDATPRSAFRIVSGDAPQ
jgi:hypothetical protein